MVGGEGPGRAEGQREPVGCEARSLWKEAWGRGRQEVDEQGRDRGDGMAGGQEAPVRQGGAVRGRGHSLRDGARGGGADDPLQVGGLEGDQDHADVLRQLPEALGVHEMVGGLASHVGLEPRSGGLVHPGRGRERWTRITCRGHRFRGQLSCDLGPAPSCRAQRRHSSKTSVMIFSFIISSELHCHRQ